MRFPCKHGNYGDCPKVIDRQQRTPGIITNVFCPGGREPTRDETIGYVKAQGWVDYQSGRTVLSAQQAVHPDRCQGLADAIVDAALGIEDK